MRAAQMLKHRAKETGGGGFREGTVEVTNSIFRVIERTIRVEETDDQGNKTWVERPAKNDKGELKGPTIALILSCQSLNPETMEPLLDAEDNPQKLELVYQIGNITDREGNVFVSVANGKSPEDEEPEVVGHDVGDEGNTLDVTSSDFSIHGATSYMMLMSSLEKTNQVRPEILERVWAPDFKGAVLEIAQRLAIPTRKDDDPYKMIEVGGRNDRPKDSLGPYKIVTKVIRPLGTADKKKSKEPVKEAAKEAATSKKPKEAKAAKPKLDPVKAMGKLLDEIGEQESGETLTFKALKKKLSAALGASDFSVDEQAEIMAAYTVDNLASWGDDSTAVSEISGDEPSSLTVKFD